MRASLVVEAEGRLILSYRDFYKSIPITLIIKEYRILQGHVLAVVHVLKLCFRLFKMDFKCKLAEAEATYGVLTAQMIENGCYLKALQ
jgi:hypothetical protein